MKIEIIHADGSRTVAQSPLDLQPGDTLIIDGKISDMKGLIVGENQIIITINGKPFIINNTDLFEKNVNDYDNIEDLLSDTSGKHTAIVFNDEDSEDGIDSIVDDINGLADLMQTEAGEEDEPKSEELNNVFLEYDREIINVESTLRETTNKRDSDSKDDDRREENDNIFDTKNGSQILGNEEGEKGKSTPDTHYESDGEEQTKETTKPISENDEDQGSSETQESKEQEEEPLPENDDSESTQDSESTEIIENHSPKIIVQNKNILTVDEDSGDIIFSKSDLLDNIYDADSNVLDIADIQTSVGEISEDNGIYTIHVPENYNGTIELTYKGTDGNLETQGKSLITVNEVNDIPVVSIIDPTVLEDESIQVPMDIQDVDGDNVTVSIFSNPSNGIVEILENGDILYTPVKDYNGPEEIILKISDKDSVTYKTVEVTVQPQNDEPTIEIVNDVTLYEDSEGIISFDIQDIDGDNINFSVNEPEHGAIIVDGTQVTYIPDHDYAGPDSIVVNYSDGTAQKSNSVNVNVLQVNDEPIIEATNEVHMIEDSVQEIIFSASDIEDGENIEINVQSDNGIAIVQDGMIIYSPNADYNGTDTIIITVKDEDGMITTKNINVQIDNDNIDIAYEIRTETLTETHTEIVEHTETRDIEVQHTRTIEVIDEEANTEAGITQNSEGQWVRTEEQTEVYTETVTETKTRDVQETFTNTRTEIVQEEYQETHTRDSDKIDFDAMEDKGFIYVKDTSRVEVEELRLGTFEGKASISDWGELKTESSSGFFGFGGSTKETIEHNQDDISAKITNSDNNFKAYAKAETSLGNGIGTADNAGISNGETMTFEIDGGTVNKAEFTLSGLGSWFDEESRHATKVTLVATDIEGNELPAQGGYRENDEKTDTYIFESPIPIASITIGTEGGSGNFVVENLILSSTDEIQIPAHWENANGEMVILSDDEIVYIQETYKTTEIRDVEVQVEFQDTRIVQEQYTEDVEVQHKRLVDVEVPAEPIMKEVQEDYIITETEEYIVQEEVQVQVETDILIMDLTDSEYDMDLSSIASMSSEKVNEINIDDNKLSNISMDDIMDLSINDSLTFTGTNGGIIDLSSLPEGEAVQKIGTVQVQDETFDTYSYSDSVGQELQMMIDTQIQVDL